ncbi:CoA-binding protein [Chitinophaga nivalis]|uniref:CoA-binding protein n=1 Tax=Chitinophaga nivalis TaxID=2991709 RepID=A0ABT3IT11_9BACT|nr:CoA-binding protein [Chitinophaga nivalis]MCW3463197.1 CoA-binding protein [Chitinophaga nivalis]MCW3487113.1 CoA-binding protein [Chitinophaga nivalis]
MDTINDKKLTVVLGASPNPERYSNMAVNRLKAKGHPVVAIGNRAAAIDDTPIITEHPALENVDTVTLYLNPLLQEAYYDYILQLQPKRIIFNPGTENEELANIAREHHIEPLEACTLVLLTTGQF